LSQSFREQIGSNLLPKKQRAQKSPERDSVRTIGLAEITDRCRSNSCSTSRSADGGAIKNHAENEVTEQAEETERNTLDYEADRPRDVLANTLDYPIAQCTYARLVLDWR